jgi:2-polyprenyl-3-methyl-5-hydroxy-6-metoxy-1,4-benzoquinol methylase
MNRLRFRYLDPSALQATESFRFVHAFLVRTRRTQIGWHYVMDLAWLHSVVDAWPRQARILDAGGGRGPLQFLLAEMGFDVVNVDLHHEPPRPEEAERYAIEQVRLGEHGEQAYVRHLIAQQPSRTGAGGRLREGALATAARRWLHRRRHERWRRSAGLANVRRGRITQVQADLTGMPHVATGSFEAVVSLSSLEHIPIGQLDAALAEIGRVVVPGGAIAITTSASASDQSWFHEPSKGWCFAAADLERRFDASDASTQSAATVLQNYRDNAFLRGNLASFYARSGDNGMPWGRWEPAYVPVAIWR